MGFGPRLKLTPCAFPCAHIDQGYDKEAGTVKIATTPNQDPLEATTGQ